jgi:hypothetical protein
VCGPRMRGCRAAGSPSPRAVDPGPAEIDKASRKVAEQTAAEGAELASSRGMNVQPRSISQTTTTGSCAEPATVSGVALHQPPDRVERSHHLAIGCVSM